MIHQLGHDRGRSSRRRCRRASGQVSCAGHKDRHACFRPRPINESAATISRAAPGCDIACVSGECRQQPSGCASLLHSRRVRARQGRARIRVAYRLEAGVHRSGVGVNALGHALRALNDHACCHGRGRTPEAGRAHAGRAACGLLTSTLGGHALDERPAHRVAITCRNGSRVFITDAADAFRAESARR